MSHTFRLLAVGLAVWLSFIGAPVSSFTLSRETNITRDDQHPEDSITLEVRNDVRRPNDIEITKEDGLIPTSEIYFKDFKFITTIQDQAVDSSIDTTQNIVSTIQNIEPTENKETTIIVTDSENSDNKNKSISFNSTHLESKPTPSWKKYTIINRKVVNSELNDERSQTEGMLTDETGVPRQDSKSGDIPSLNQIKNFLFPSSFFKSDVQNDTISTVGVTEQSLTNTETSVESTTATKANVATVESKRGGFLDFSLKSLFEDNDKKENSQENTTSKPKGRKLSWRFGSRYRGKEDNSAEKSKERTRYRFRNNKDRKTDSNETKESKEEYSKEIDSRENSDKKTLRPIEKDSNSEIETKVSKNQNDVKEKAILAEWNQYENNNRKPEKKEHDEVKTTTDINIWNTGSGEKTRSREKEQLRISEFKTPEQRSEARRPHSSNNREDSRDNNSKNRGRNTPEVINNRDEYSQSKSRGRNNKDNIKERYNERKTDINGHKDGKEYDTQNENKKEEGSHIHNMKNDGMDSHVSLKPSNTKYNEDQTNQYAPIKKNESNEESKQKIMKTDSKSTSEIIDITNSNDIKQKNINSDKQVTIEYIKQFLSTIDEEEENEGHSPIIEEISTAKPVDVQDIKEINYSPDFKFNDKDSTTEPMNSYEPFKIPNLLISLPSLRNKDGSREYSKLNQNEAKEFINTLKTTTESGITEKLKFSTDFVNPTTSEQKYETPNKDMKNTEAIVQMHEDDRREELLKEEVINNNEENFGKYNNEFITTTQQTTIPVKIYEINKKPDDEKLSVKPLTFLDKLKTTILYPVSGNYKPLKKIEVQPPKSFVRDPDDNSWRNESLSSLGIVFKPKNSSKPFTQVLKNKTETEWNNLMEKQIKSEAPDLRERLEKIAEMRKSKKKKTDAYGNVLYNDYEESLSKETKDSEFSTTTTTTMISTTSVTSTSTVAPSTEGGTLNYSKSVTNSSTEKPKKVFNVADYYDTSDEDDADYLTLAKIDLKKFTVPIRTDAYVTPPTWLVTNTRPNNHNNYERKPTLQYFPPLTTQKGMFRDYETEFHKKMAGYTETEPPTNVLPVSYTIPSPFIQSDRKEHILTPITKNSNDKTTEFIDYQRPGFMTQAPVVPDAKDGYTVISDDGSYNRAADVIKHYRDFLNAVAKDNEEDINDDYIPYTKFPTQGVTVSDIIHKVKPKPDIVEHYDYENDFRKDVLQRFVHNFNQNSERFKSGLPLLYNNSIIHGSVGDGRDVASSRTYLSRMLTRPSGDCDNNATVELSPAYELHYYVPEEEEKEQVDPKTPTLPYKNRL